MNDDRPGWCALIFTIDVPGTRTSRQADTQTNKRTNEILLLILITQQQHTAHTHIPRPHTCPGTTIIWSETLMLFRGGEGLYFSAAWPPKKYAQADQLGQLPPLLAPRAGCRLPTLKNRVAKPTVP